METPTTLRLLASTNNARDDLFTRLVGDLFFALGYDELRFDVQKSGCEIDILGSHRHERRRLVAECKAHKDKMGGSVEPIGRGVMTVNGHCTYLPGNQWILNDTYPQGKDRKQSPYLFHVATGRRVWLGHFHLPAEYRGRQRYPRRGDY